MIVKITRWGMLTGVMAAAALLAYGLIRFPAALSASPTGLRSLIGIIVILVIYSALAWFGPAHISRAHPEILRAGVIAGLAGGLVFMAEIAAEYWLLPQDNSQMGLL